MRQALLAFAIFIGFATPAFAYTGATCNSTDGEDRAACMATIGAVRSIIGDANTSDPACARGARDDLQVSYAVIDWIKAHPERQGEDLAALAREALMQIDPCAQRGLIPEMNLSDPIDTE
ncbi:hypothetical protein [Dongia sp.]|uniref:hypothetical protein n=1 Tax=Dongia sp. TaxID=1977262 RepID=UPI0035ADD8F3